MSEKDIKKLNELQDQWSELVESLQQSGIDLGKAGKDIKKLDSITSKIQKLGIPGSEVLVGMSHVLIGSYHLENGETGKGSDRIHQAMDLFLDSPTIPSDAAIDPGVMVIQVLLANQQLDEALKIHDKLAAAIDLDRPVAIQLLLLGGVLQQLKGGDDQANYLQRAFKVAGEDKTGDTYLTVAEYFLSQDSGEESLELIRDTFEKIIIPGLVKIYESKEELKAPEGDPESWEFDLERARLRREDYQTGNAVPYPLVLCKTYLARTLLDLSQYEEALDLYRELEHETERLEILGEHLPEDQFMEDEDEDWEDDIWAEDAEGGDYDPYDDEDSPDFDESDLEEDDDFAEVIGIFSDEESGRVYTAPLGGPGGVDDTHETERALLRFDNHESLDQLYTRVTVGRAMALQMLGGTRGDRKLLEEALDEYEDFIDLVRESESPLALEELEAKAAMVRQQLDMLK